MSIHFHFTVPSGTGNQKYQHHFLFSWHGSVHVNRACNSLDTLYCTPQNSQARMRAAGHHCLYSSTNPICIGGMPAVLNTGRWRWGLGSSFLGGNPPPKCSPQWYLNIEGQVSSSKPPMCMFWYSYAHFLYCCRLFFDIKCVCTMTASYHSNRI